MKTYGEWKHKSTILDVYIRFRWVVTFKFQPLYPGETSPRCPLDRKLGGPLQGLETLALQPVAVTIELQRDFSYLHIFNIYLYLVVFLVNF
jgi:hypothetical protein